MRERETLKAAGSVAAGDKIYGFTWSPPSCSGAAEDRDPHPKAFRRSPIRIDLFGPTFTISELSQLN